MTRVRQRFTSIFVEFFTTLGKMKTLPGGLHENKTLPGSLYEQTGPSKPLSGPARGVALQRLASRVLRHFTG